MKIILASLILCLTGNSYAGEFSKIDLVVRETIEAHYASEDLDFFEDIVNLRIETNQAQCDLVVSAKVLIQPIATTEEVCITKLENSYTGQIL